MILLLLQSNWCRLVSVWVEIIYAARGQKEQYADGCLNLKSYLNLLSAGDQRHHTDLFHGGTELRYPESEASICAHVWLLRRWARNMQLWVLNSIPHHHQRILPEDSKAKSWKMVKEQLVSLWDVRESPFDINHSFPSCFQMNPQWFHTAPPAAKVQYELLLNSTTLFQSSFFFFWIEHDQF